MGASMLHSPLVPVPYSSGKSCAYSYLVSCGGLSSAGGSILSASLLNPVEPWAKHAVG